MSLQPGCRRRVFDQATADGLYLSKVNNDTAAGLIQFEKGSFHHWSRRWGRRTSTQHQRHYLLLLLFHRLEDKVYTFDHVRQIAMKIMLNCDFYHRRHRWRS